MRRREGKRKEGLNRRRTRRGRRVEWRGEEDESVFIEKFVQLRRSKSLRYRSQNVFKRLHLSNSPFHAPQLYENRKTRDMTSNTRTMLFSLSLVTHPPILLMFLRSFE